MHASVAVTPFAYSACCHLTQQLAQACCKVTVQLVPLAVPVIKGAVYLFLLRGFGPNLKKREELYKIFKPNWIDAATVSLFPACHLCT